MFRKINLSYSSTVNTDVTVGVNVPADVKPDELLGYIRSVDWATIVELQATEEEIVEGSEVEHVELLSAEFAGDDTYDDKCECEYNPPSIVPGVLFPWNSDLDIAGVERCDQCKRFASDEEAGKALEKALHDRGAVNLHVRPVDKDGHLSVCATFAGDMHIPLTFEQGEQVYKYQLKRRKE